MSSAPLLHEVPRRDARPADGASAAAAVLYERYYKRVYGFCLYHLGSREEAEDAAQTTFLSALRGLERGVVPQLEANWLFTIARNTCRSRFRTRGVNREHELLSDPHVLQAVAPDGEPSGDELFSLEEALADMPELQRRAILLREWRGCSYREIAEEMGLSAGAVETLIFRARRSLAQRLEHPPASKRAGLFSGFGPFFAGLKGTLGLGTAAKAGLAVSTAVLAVGLGLPSDVPQGSPGRERATIDSPAPGSGVQAPTGSAGGFDPAEKGPQVRPHRAPKRGPAPAKGHEPGATGRPAPATGGVGVVPEGTIEPVVDKLNDTVGDVTGAVDEVVDGLAPVLPPNVQLPDLDVPALGLG
jgi:RNA polymerase sigma-70 factor (ECF subfamily)